MYSPNDNEFQYKQNNDQQNMKRNDPQELKSNINVPEYVEKKVIISQNPSIGINIEEQVSEIQQFYEKKILHEYLSKAVIGIFEKKQIISPGQFQIQKAYEDASKCAQYYTDRIQKWLGDAVVNNPAMNQFQKYKAKKFEERTAKVNSIMNWIQKIADKLQQKKIQEVKKQFQKSLADKVVTIPQNKQYKRAIYKLKFIKQRVAETQKTLQNKIRNGQPV